MLTSLIKACGDLGCRTVLAVLVVSLAISLALFAALAASLSWAMTGTDPCGTIGLGTCPLDAVGGTVSGIAVTLLAMWLMFPAIALGVIAGFSDRIVSAIEARHYPDRLAEAHPLGAGGTALLGLRSGARLLAINLLASPFYLILLVTGVGPLILFVVLNGWAAGRDFGEMVAYRHGDAAARREWLIDTRGARAGIGAATACLFLVPVLNLLAPILGAAATTHLFHRAHWR